jgi:uncharacterized protein (TIGR02246 family)
MGANSVGPESELKEAVAAFDHAFKEKRLEEFLSYFADDAEFLAHHSETATGKEAIRANFVTVFDLFDIPEYEPEYSVVDVHDDRAYVLGEFDEALRRTDGKPGVRIHGRIVQFWRRDGDGAWRLVRVLTARSAPDEPEG